MKNISVLFFAFISALISFSAFFGIILKYDIYGRMIFGTIWLVITIFWLIIFRRVKQN